MPEFLLKKRKRCSIVNLFITWSLKHFKFSITGKNFFSKFQNVSYSRQRAFEGLFQL